MSSSNAVITKKQKSLILFLEDQIVNVGGRVVTQHMNKDDFEQVEVWAEAGFIGFGRIASQDVNVRGSHWVTFTDEAWTAAHAERRERGIRVFARRSYQTTEKRI